MRIALTTGEPAGIGPEIAIAALPGLAPEVEVTLLGDRNLLARVRQNQLPPDRELSIEHIALAAPVAAGRLDPRNARYVLSLLDRAIAGALSGEFDAIVTAPVHKGVINDGGEPKQSAGFQRVVQRAAHYAEGRGRPNRTGAELLVAIFAETESPAARLLGEQDMTRQDAINFIIHGITKGG